MVKLPIKSVNRSRMRSGPLNFTLTVFLGLYLSEDGTLLIVKLPSPSEVFVLNTNILIHYDLRPCDLVSSSIFT